jgi:hypothetical protein
MDSAPISPVLEDAHVSAERLNRECVCVTLDPDALFGIFEREAGDPDFCARTSEHAPRRCRLNGPHEMINAGWRSQVLEQLEPVGFGRLNG